MCVCYRIFQIPFNVLDKNKVFNFTQDQNFVLSCFTKMNLFDVELYVILLICE